ncbi:hypothetical protein WMY93_026604 [Mugilogobius chulae]|uniref:Uncharacterized protein n=1 Tax=Mugilogobius chulae TaxID=88201 RepID=A0AAW0N924_9GOBI
MIKHKLDEGNGVNPKRFNMLAKTRQTWKMDGMNTVEYEILSKEYMPLYTNITVNIGTEAGLKPLPKPPPTPAKAPPNSAPKEPAKPPAVTPTKLKESLLGRYVHHPASLKHGRYKMIKHKLDEGNGVNPKRFKAPPQAAAHSCQSPANSAPKEPAKPPAVTPTKLKERWLTQSLLDIGDILNLLYMAALSSASENSSVGAKRRVMAKSWTL